MKPIQHPACNDVLRRPPGTTEEECGDLVRKCDFCGGHATLTICHQGTGKQWSACELCVTERRMRRRLNPYTISNLPNTPAEPPPVGSGESSNTNPEVR